MGNQVTSENYARILFITSALGYIQFNILQVHINILI